MKRRLLFIYLEIIRSLSRISSYFSGNKKENEHTKRVLTGRTWEEFCDQVKLAGSALHHPGTPKDVFNQSEGIRYLTRLTRAALEAFVEYGDPSFPVLRRMVHETVKMGADNPDNYYFNAQISGDYEYRITGKRNTVFYIGFFTQNGNYGTTGGMEPCDVLEGKDLLIDRDGSFEIFLSREKKGKNWLKIEKETGLVIVRQTFHNRFEEIPAELEITNLNGKNHPDPLTPERIDEGLKTASLFIAGAPLLFARWAKGFQKHVNRLPQFDPAKSNAAGGDANIIYYHSYWKLEYDEALVISVDPPACDLCNFQLNNYWMESLDYRYFNICINKGSAVYEKDGSLKIIISHQDPGIKNWLDTCGHTEGTMCWRWYRLHKGASPVEPTCEVVLFNNLNKI